MHIRIRPVKIIRPLRTPRKVPPLPSVWTRHIEKFRGILRHGIVLNNIDHHVPQSQVLDVLRDRWDQLGRDSDARAEAIVLVAVGPLVFQHLARSDGSFVEFFDLGFRVHFVFWFGLIDGWFDDVGLGKYSILIIIRWKFGGNNILAFAGKHGSILRDFPRLVHIIRQHLLVLLLDGARYFVLIDPLRRLVDGLGHVVEGGFRGEKR
mmetsp:Transcript_14020/g.30210  ORF Transcript_14020/g.30210 Transcript_14020/m.30210 type:complete len:207 (+) Transcript_14020:899-1519(+)